MIHKYKWRTFNCVYDLNIVIKHIIAVVLCGYDYSGLDFTSLDKQWKHTPCKRVHCTLTYVIDKWIAQCFNVYIIQCIAVVLEWKSISFWMSHGKILVALQSIRKFSYMPLLSPASNFVNITFITDINLCYTVDQWQTKTTTKESLSSFTMLCLCYLLSGQIRTAWNGQARQASLPVIWLWSPSV